MKWRRTASLGVAAAALTHAVWAEEGGQSLTNGVTELPPVIVEASRLGRTTWEMSMHVEVLTRERIAESGARSTVDLLEKCSSVQVRRMNANPALAQIAMRGYGTTGFARVKILVDGEVLNNADMAPQDLMRVPVQDIERVEILHGPQTVLHGDHASAGVINIVTGGGSYERKTIVGLHGGSWETIGFHAGTRGGSEPDGVTYFAQADWDRSDGFRANGAHERWATKGGVAKEWTNGSRMGLTVFHSDAQYGLPGGLYDGMVFGTDYGSWKDRARDADDTYAHARTWAYGANANGTFVLAEDQRLETALSFRQRHAKSAWVTSFTDYESETVQGTVSYVNEHRLAGFDQCFTTGFSFDEDLIRAQTGVKNRYTRFTGSLFAHEEVFLLDEETLSLFAGVRGMGLTTRNRFRGNGLSDAETRGTGRVAGEAGVNWRPVESAKVFARWSRFYHSPLADEMFSTYGLPNLDLVPETGQSVEGGFTWTVEKEWTASLTAFHTSVSDEILYSAYYQNVNAPDETRRDGVEAFAGWARDKVGAFGVRYTYTEAKFTEGAYAHRDLPLVPRHRVRVTGAWYLTETLRVQGGWRLAGSQRYDFDFANAGGAIPRYHLFDAGVQWKPETWLKGFTFGLTVDNLLDARYTDYAGYYGYRYVYPAAGRCYLFSVQYEF